MVKITEQIKILGSKYTSNFAIDSNNQKQIEQLIYYFMWDKKFSGDLTKGLLLRGSIGSGKSILLKIFSIKEPNLNFNQTKNFLYYSVIDVYMECINGGFQSIENYCKFSNLEESDKWKNTICFDELGVESLTAKNYGNSVNIMEMIIQKRYNNWQNHGQLTHFTTNLTPDEIENSYGERVRSRLAEMCNDICLLGNDRRRV